MTTTSRLAGHPRAAATAAASNQDGLFRLTLRVVAILVVIPVLWMMVDTFAETVPVWQRFGIPGS